MNRIPICTFALLAAAIGVIYKGASTVAISGRAETSEFIRPAALPKHDVSLRMIHSCRQMLEKSAPSFEAKAADGQTYTYRKPGERAPMVLTFIKDACPCSEAAQPFFNRLRIAYPEAEFFGVIDRDGENAKSWALKFQIAYPLLMDPTHRIVRDYEAESSAYVVLIDTEGRIVNYWPGYSTEMLKDLGKRLAELTEVDERQFNLANAPSQLYSGCPFDL